MKLSFSLSSSKSSSSSRPNPTGTLKDGGRGGGGGGGGGHEEATATATANHEFVTVFDPTVTLTTDGASVPSIAPLPNTDSWRAPKRMKNLLPPPSDPNSSSSGTPRFELDTSQPDAAAGSYGLTLRSKGGDGSNDFEHEISVQSELPVSADRKFREEIQNLPEDRGFDEFADVSVEDFSKAVLAGYGWKVGQGIGRNAKEDTKVVEYKKWGNGGLGYTPDMPSSELRGRKRVHEELAPIPPPRIANGSARGGKKKVVRVISGEHAGLKGEVLETSSHSDSTRGMVVLSLLKSGVEVKVGVDMVAELGSVEEEKCLKKLELDIRRRDERREDRKEDGRKDKSGRDEDGRGGKSRRDEDGRSGNSGAKGGNGRHHRSSDDRERDPVSWLRSHIRVRIISKDLKGGKVYLKKGKVMDVVGPMTCDLLLEENGELLQGVNQEILETALPKRGGPVLVLFGRNKGVFGNLVEKDSEKETAIIRDADSHELIKVRLEQIAEYVGDPSILGY